MRDIKFRVWCGEPIGMQYNIVAGSVGCFYALIDPKDTASLNPTSKYHNNAYLMQYTGLKSNYKKQQQEIYEGDIVILHPYCFNGSVSVPMQVVYNKDGFELRHGGFNLYDLGRPSMDTIEVIGNIYEHPDLLTTN